MGKEELEQHKRENTDLAKQVLEEALISRLLSSACS